MRTTRILIPLLLGLAITACKDATSPPHPTTLSLVGQAPTSADAGAVVSDLAVVVNDQHGQPMAGQPLQIVASTGGSLSAAPTRTVAGATPLGQWTLQKTVGLNTLTVTSGTLQPLTISVQGTAGPIGKLESSTPTTGQAVVGQEYPVRLRALDRYDNPTMGTVSFAITGGGVISATSGAADSSGNVATPRWTLGTRVGRNTLTAAAGSDTLVYTIDAAADAPAAASVVSGDGQTALAGTAPPTPIVVAFADRYGNPTPGVAVSFSPSAGGGTVDNGGNATTDSTGAAASPTWTLGKRLVPQAVTASAGATTAIVNATVQPGMPVGVRFFGTLTDSQEAVFLGAVERLRAMVMSGGGPATADNFDVATACGATGVAPVTETVNGIVIYATVDSIDGPGNIVGQSGPCGFRSAASGYLPAYAVLEFDEADFAHMMSLGTAEAVVLHEMMHSFGFGIFWSLDNLMTGDIDVDPEYLGPNGIASCRALGGLVTCASSVPVENTGGDGTRGGHWRALTFPNELMTGWITKPNYMSAISIGSLTDLGYTVNLAAADPYIVAAGLRAGASGGMELKERLRGLPRDPSALRPAGGVLGVTPGRMNEAWLNGR